MKKLKVKKVRAEETTVDFREITRDYLAVRVRNLFPNEALPCDIYFPYLQSSHSLKLERTLHKGHLYDPTFHAHLVKNQVKVTYIRKEDEDAFFEYFNNHLQGLVKSSETPVEVKIQLLYDDAENIVKKVFRERPTQLNIRLGKQLIDHFSTTLCSDDITSDALLSIFSKDYYTFTHSVQVAFLGMAFGRHLGWEEKVVKDFGLGALFHDLGKVSIDDAILNKPGRLEPEEFEIIKKHSSLGYNQIKKTLVMSREQLDVVLYHHEAMDGSGYPDQLSGEKVPIFARIARIVDCYDALTTNRPYKSAMTPPKAISVMRDEMGHTFDRQYLGSFMSFLGMSDQARQLQSQRIQIEVGVRVLLELEQQNLRLKSLLVGMEEDKYLILRIPYLADVAKSLNHGDGLQGRYLCGGNVYQFRCTIISHMLFPIKLLFLTYPKSFKIVNLRKHPRIDCFLPGQVSINGCAIEGVVLDISVGGCQMAVKQSEQAASPDLKINVPVTVETRLFGEAEASGFPGKIRHIGIDDEKTVLGIQFDELDDDSHDKLYKCMENVLSLVQ